MRRSRHRMVYLVCGAYSFRRLHSPSSFLPQICLSLPLRSSRRHREGARPPGTNVDVLNNQVEAIPPLLAICCPTSSLWLEAGCSTIVVNEARPNKPDLTFYL